MQIRSLRLFLSVILSASLIWTAAGQSSAAANAHIGLLTEMVICAHDGETRIVLIDGRGEPIDPAKPCSKGHCFLCVGSNITGPMPSGVQLGECPQAQLVIRSAQPTLGAARDIHPTSARAPPFEI